MSDSAFATQSRGSREMATMNITPLVDVMLVLLVIFMIAAPVVTRSLPLDLGRGNGRSEPPPRVQLQVQADGNFLLDGVQLGAASLDVALRSVAQRSPDSVIQIDASGDADYQGFTTALASARRNGLGHIALRP